MLAPAFKSEKVPRLLYILPLGPPSKGGLREDVIHAGRKIFPAMPTNNFGLAWPFRTEVKAGYFLIPFPV